MDDVTHFCIDDDDEEEETFARHNRRQLLSQSILKDEIMFFSRN